MARAQLEAKLREQFTSHFGRWVVMMKAVNWKTDFDVDSVPNPPSPSNILNELRDINLGSFYQRLIESDPDRKKFGYLPFMATHSVASVGSLLSASFCERINSAGALILNKGNTLLASDELSKLAVLRVNRKWMVWARSRYGKKVSKQTFNMTLAS